MEFSQHKNILKMFNFNYNRRLRTSYVKLTFYMSKKKVKIKESLEGNIKLIFFKWVFLV